MIKPLSVSFSVVMGGSHDVFKRHCLLFVGLGCAVPHLELVKPGETSSVNFSREQTINGRPVLSGICVPLKSLSSTVQRLAAH